MVICLEDIGTLDLSTGFTAQECGSKMGKTLFMFFSFSIKSHRTCQEWKNWQVDDSP
jgi:hypothetical protein